MNTKLKSNFTILIAGGTGGHMYPAIAILDEIKQDLIDNKILNNG